MPKARERYGLNAKLGPPNEWGRAAMMEIAPISCTA